MGPEKRLPSTIKRWTTMMTTWCELLSSDKDPYGSHRPALLLLVLTKTVVEAPSAVRGEFLFSQVYVNLSSSLLLSPSMMPDKTLWPRVSTCPLQSMETMIDVSSDISQLITSYPIDSPSQISGTAVFQRMDFVPRCPSPRQSSFLKALGLIENLTWTIRGTSSLFRKKKRKKRNL